MKTEKIATGLAYAGLAEMPKAERITEEERNV
jgi:hypothetical protein